MVRSVRQAAASGVSPGRTRVTPGRISPSAPSTSQVPMTTRNARGSTIGIASNSSGRKNFGAPLPPAKNSANRIWTVHRAMFKARVFPIRVTPLQTRGECGSEKELAGYRTGDGRALHDADVVAERVAQPHVDAVVALDWLLGKLDP